MLSTHVAALFGQLTTALQEIPDVDLLQRFATDRDAEAFHEIVRRHGAMVHDVCQSVLRHHADSDDAVQATFWLLAQKPATLRRPAALAAWLHGTAYRMALKARTRAMRRRRHEARVVPTPPNHTADVSWLEVRQVVHEAIQQLPERERQAIVLCYLQGTTQEQAADALGLSRDGIKKRLERGRERLRTILERRGFGPTAFLGVLTWPLVPLAVAQVRSTAQLCVQQSVPVAVRALARGGFPIMLLSKILGVVAVVGVCALALTLSDPSPAAPTLPAKKEDPIPDLGDNVKADANLVGEWFILAMEADGKAIPDEQYKGVRVRIGKDQMHFIWPKDLTPLIGSASIETDLHAKPKSIDMKWLAKEHDGKVSRGIYQIVSGQLKIGVRQPENAKMPRPKGYATVSGTIISITLERPRMKPE